ncbi:enoyl-CoA hydratase-related protein [Tardiphaga sp. 215_C5_N2_1]|uniref:enoyl-CoA hydratase-related protein n=1 Tax=Tardiphaga sp. 215_C5_N2_1 TaxID=3240774 RepID=UPI003F892665
MSDIEITKDGQVAIVTLNRGPQRNAVTHAMWKELASIFAGFNANTEVRGVILTGAGGNFSVGADVSEFGKVRSDGAQSKAYEVAVDAASEAIANARMPVIAVLAGYCLGGGCHLAMACDFRFAERDAAIGIPAAKLSIVYGVRSTQRLMSLVGLTNAKRVLYSADRYTAAEAASMGLVDEVSADPMSDALQYAKRIGALAPLSVEGAKRILTGIAMGEGRLDVAEANAFIDRVSDSADYREGRRAFAEKRSPDFRGS